MTKPWAGRFAQATTTSVEAFTESISYDSRLYAYDVQGSIAHATMLAEVGLLSKAEMRKIIAGLKWVKKEFDAGRVELDPAFEDIHMFVEHLLTEKIGPLGKKLHTARSRNDQVATDIRLWMKDVAAGLETDLVKLQKSLLKKARKYESWIMPSFTHLQHAQPMGVAHYLLAFVEKFGRDVTRLQDCVARMDEMPLGSCALTGTILPIDRRITCKLLDFKRPTRNSLDTVSDRDFLIEFASTLSLIATHISNFCEDMVLWCSAEYGYITIDDGYCTGSSIMPQKKNPDVHELLRGKTARVHGALYSLLTLMKGLPQAYNRDMQEDKERIFDSFDTVAASVSILTEVIDHTHFNKKRLEDSCRKGFMEATALAEYLVLKGVYFRDAHHIVGTIVKLAEDAECALADLSLESMREVCEAIEKDVYAVLTCEAILSKIRSLGGTGRASIKRNLTFWSKKLR